MSNKISALAIAGLAVVCVGLLYNNCEKNKITAKEFPLANDEGGFVSVSSFEQKKYIGNEYAVTFKILQKNKSKEVVFKQLNESREKVLSLLKTSGFSEKDYSYSGMKLAKDWEYREKKTEFVGYVAEQEFTVKSQNRDVIDSLELSFAKVPYVEDVLVQGRLKNADSLEMDVVRKACQKTIQRAKQYAGSVDAKLGAVYTVQGNSGLSRGSLSDSVEIHSSISADFHIAGNEEKSYVNVFEERTKNFVADRFLVTANVSMYGAQKDVLYKGLNDKRNVVLSFAKKMGVTDSDLEVQTARIRKRSSWELERGDRHMIYEATQRIVVSFESKKSAAAFLATLSSGIEDLSVDVQSVLKNQDSIQAQVVKEAGEKALMRAQAVAEGFGDKLGPVVSVGDGSSSDRFMMGGVLGAPRAKGRLAAGYNEMDMATALGSGRNSSLCGDITSGDMENCMMNIADSVEVSAFISIRAEMNP